MAVEQLVEASHLGYFSPLVLPLIATTIVLCVAYWWQENKYLAKMGNKIPGPPRLPFIGNAHYFIGKTHNQILEKAMEMSYQYGNVARGWLGNKLVIFLTHPDDVELILSSHDHIDKSNEYRFFKPWLGDGLLISTGEKWRSHRKLIAPAFHMNVLKSFMPNFNSNSRAVVNRLRKEIGCVFDVHDYMSQVTVDILLETAMGTKRTHENQEGFDYAMAVMKYVIFFFIIKIKNYNHFTKKKKQFFNNFNSRMCDIIHSRHFKILLRYDAIFSLTGFKKQQEKLLSIIHGLTKKVDKIVANDKRW